MKWFNNPILQRIVQYKIDACLISLSLLALFIDKSMSLQGCYEGNLILHFYSKVMQSAAYGSTHKELAAQSRHSLRKFN